MAAAQILCTKCASASAEPRLECAKCGGRNARVCGKCGNQNSVAKNFCDKCGQSLVELAPSAPTAPATRPAVPPSAGPAAAQRPPAAPPAAPAAKPAPLPAPGTPLPAARERPGALPHPGPAAPSLASPLDDLWSAPPPPPAAVERIARSKPSAWRGRLNLLAALAGMAGAAYGVWTYRENRKPEIVVTKLAARYLEALRTRDYALAYGLFTDAAKRAATVDEFRDSRNGSSWTWSDLRVERREPGAVLMAYDLAAAGAPARKDYLLFTRDGDRWARPYNWTLLRKVEEAIDKGEPDKGLILAQEAAMINTRDPMAWGDLCEAAYDRKSPGDAEPSCVRAIELARTYPSNLTLKSLYRLHAILADTYNRSLRDPGKAIAQYAEMLAFPRVAPADQCRLLLARSQAYASIGRPGESLDDLERGSRLCADPRDKALIQKMKESLRAPDAQ